MRQDKNNKSSNGEFHFDKKIRILRLKALQV